MVSTIVFSYKENDISAKWKQIQLKSHISHLDLFRTPTDDSNAKTSDKDYNVVAGEKKKAQEKKQQHS